MALTGAGEVGFIEEVYYDADGDIASPTWVLMPGVQDVQVSSQSNKSEIAVRNEDFVGVVPTHKVVSITVTLTKRNGDTNYDALREAHFSNTKIGVAAMTGPVATVGEKGFQAEAYVTGWDDDGAHEGNSVSVTIEPAANATTAADYVTISS
jgi:hypothetical protein